MRESWFESRLGSGKSRGSNPYGMALVGCSTSEAVDGSAFFYRLRANQLPVKE